MFCSVTLNCHFLKFSPPARVSKTSLDCIVCFLVNDKAKRFFFFLPGMHEKSGLFFIQICDEKQTCYRASLVFTSDEWSWDYSCVFSVVCAWACRSKNTREPTVQLHSKTCSHLPSTSAFNASLALAAITPSPDYDCKSFLSPHHLCSFYT